MKAWVIALVVILFAAAVAGTGFLIALKMSQWAELLQRKETTHVTQGSALDAVRKKLPAAPKPAQPAPEQPPSSKANDAQFPTPTVSNTLHRFLRITRPDGEVICITRTPEGRGISMPCFDPDELGVRA